MFKLYFNVIQISLIAMKLTDNLTCSWWWILAPTIMILVLSFALAVLLVYFAPKADSAETETPEEVSDAS